MTEPTPIEPLTEAERAMMTELQQRDALSAWQDRETARLARLGGLQAAAAFADAISTSDLQALSQAAYSGTDEDDEPDLRNSISRLRQMIEFDGAAIVNRIAALRTAEPAPQFDAAPNP